MPTFDAQEFMGLAITVASSEPNEAGYRTAINRAYYACHLVGRDSTAKKGWFEPKHTYEDHSGLLRALQDHDVPWRPKLRDLRELREHADYHTHLEVNRATWERAKLIAQDILPRLKNIAPQAK